MKYSNKYNYKSIQTTTEQGQANYRKLVNQGTIEEWKPKFYWLDKPDPTNPLKVNCYFGVKFYADYSQWGNFREVTHEESFTKHRAIERAYYIKFMRRSRLIQRLWYPWLRALAIRLLLRA